MAAVVPFFLGLGPPQPTFWKTTIAPWRSYGARRRTQTTAFVVSSLQLRAPILIQICRTGEPSQFAPTLQRTPPPQSFTEA